MIGSLSFADEQKNTAVLKQMEFFLFLAESVEVAGELTTLVDMEEIESESMAVEISSAEEMAKPATKQAVQEQEALK